jgi:hypothetical protein
MRRLEGDDDALGLGDELGAVQSFVVGGGEIPGAPRLPQVGVLRTDAGIVESRAHGVRFENLTVVVGQHHRARTVKDSDPPRRERRRVLSRGDAFTCRFHSVK